RDRRGSPRTHGERAAAENAARGSRRRSARGAAGSRAVVRPADGVQWPDRAPVRLGTRAEPELRCACGALSLGGRLPRAHAGARAVHARPHRSPDAVGAGAHRGIGSRRAARCGGAPQRRDRCLDRRVLVGDLAPRLLRRHAGRDVPLPQGRRARAVADHHPADRVLLRVRLWALRDGARRPLSSRSPLRLAGRWLTTSRAALTIGLALSEEDAMGGQWRVVAAGPWDDPGWQHALEEAGCEVVLGRSFERFPGQAYTEDELIDLFKSADAVLVSSREQVTRRVLEACPHLKIVAKATIGVERIDLDGATDSEIGRAHV